MGYTKEIWKPIPFAPGFEASDRGRVRKGRRVCRLYHYPNHPERYVLVAFNGLTRPVHRCVLAAFRGESTLVTNHKNGIKTDNRLENLEYCTVRENNIHAQKTGLKVITDHHRATASRLMKERHARGEVKGSRKLTVKDILEIRSMRNSSSFRLGAIYGVGSRNINHIRSRDSWCHVTEKQQQQYERRQTRNR